MCMYVYICVRGGYRRITYMYIFWAYCFTLLASQSALELFQIYFFTSP